MIRKLLLIGFTLAIAFAILLISILRTAAVRYEFTGDAHPDGASSISGMEEEIDYYLPYPGKVLPDSPLWNLKVIRDKIWLFATTDWGRKGDLYLLFADKRIASSKALFEKSEPEQGYETLLKAEQYLERAQSLEADERSKGADTNEFLSRIARSSLRHLYVMEEIKKIAPEDAIPNIVEVSENTKRIYMESSEKLKEVGGNVPENPFNW